MLNRLIKEESLRTYLFTYSHVYASISMTTLAAMFELDKLVVHSIISKMIINEELMVMLKYISFFLLKILRISLNAPWFTNT
jgi:translation initiation factor 3 subunit C